MVLDAAATFISGRTLKVQFPETAGINIARALQEGKKSNECYPISLKNWINMNF